MCCSFCAKTSFKLPQLQESCVLSVPCPVVFTLHYIVLQQTVLHEKAGLLKLCTQTVKGHGNIPMSKINCAMRTPSTSNRTATFIPLLPRAFYRKISCREDEDSVSWPRFRRAQRREKVQRGRRLWVSWLNGRPVEGELNQSLTSWHPLRDGKGVCKRSEMLWMCQLGCLISADHENDAGEHVQTFREHQKVAFVGYSEHHCVTHKCDWLFKKDILCHSCARKKLLKPPE